MSEISVLNLPEIGEYDIKDATARNDIASKQDALTFDNTPTNGSNNPVKSGGIYSALSNKSNSEAIAPLFDTTETYSAGDLVMKDGNLYSFKNAHTGAWSASDVDETDVSEKLNSKQNILTFDSTPTNESNNAVASGGVYSALATKQDKVTRVGQLQKTLTSGTNWNYIGTYTSTSSDVGKILYFFALWTIGKPVGIGFGDSTSLTAPNRGKIVDADGDYIYPRPLMSYCSSSGVTYNVYAKYDLNNASAEISVYA